MAQTRVASASPITSSEFQKWLKGAKLGALYLDVYDRLYIKTVFGHETIHGAAVKQAIKSREAAIRSSIERSDWQRLRFVAYIAILVAAAYLK